MLLAGVPFILILASALGYFLGESPDRATQIVQQLIDRLLPPQLGIEGSVLDPVMADVRRTRFAFGIGGLVFFLFFSGRLFGSLRSVMSVVFEHGRDRGFFRGMLWDVQLSIWTVGLTLAWIVVSAFLTFSTGRVGRTLMDLGVTSEVLGGVEVLIGRLIALGIVVAIFLSLYRWLPKERTPWIPSLSGGVAAGLLFELARWVFGVLVRTFPPSSVYSGTLGALIIVVFWTYYAALIFVLGAEFAAATHEQIGEMQTD